MAITTRAHRPVARSRGDHRGRRGALLAVGVAGLLGAALLEPVAASADDTVGALALTPSSGRNDTRPFASFTGDSACPEGFRAYVTLDLVGLDGTSVEPSFADVTSAPEAAPAGSRTSPLASSNLASGTYRLEYTCYNDDFSATKVADSVLIRVDDAAGTWSVTGDQTPGQVATTTVVAANPVTATEGDPVALVATVTGAGAAGQVEFRDGTRSVGTAPVVNGSASLSTSALAAGAHEITATFTPTDATAYTASTSQPATVTVTPAAGENAPGGKETIKVTVPQDGGSSDFTLTVDPTDVTLTVADSTATGTLSPITVTDQRTTSPGWSVSGQAAAFTSGAQSIPANNLGWTPAIAGDTHGAVPGAKVEPGETGLSSPAVLASAPDTAGKGTTKLGGTLTLAIPAATPPGSYVTTLTVTTLTAAVS